jgi:hypothetical protein
VFFEFFVPRPLLGVWGSCINATVLSWKLSVLVLFSKCVYETVTRLFYETWFVIL